MNEAFGKNMTEQMASARMMIEADGVKVCVLAVVRDAKTGEAITGSDASDGATYGLAKSVLLAMDREVDRIEAKITDAARRAKN